MDLEAYFQRIAYDGPRVANLESLGRVAYRHALTIPFENLDPWLGIRPSLDPEAVTEKLVTQQRGGWCFEQNLLLGNALREMGFEVRDLAARVVWRRAPDANVPRTHRVLQVRCDGREWLADAGFGGQSMTRVLELESDEDQATPHEPFRLRWLGDERLVETRIQGMWWPMYRVDLQPQQPADFEAANFHLANDPGSHFVTELKAALPTPVGRHSLRDGELSRHDLAGNTERCQLNTAAEVMTALRDMFGINLAGLHGLEQRLSRMLSMNSQAGTAVGTPVGTPARS